jgi:hypothetical protein
LTAVELRVHGVGGDAPHSVLGLPYATDVATGAQLGDRVALVRPVDDDTRSAFVWGELTSGSRLFALWTLVMPFTLANVAGWMHPPCPAHASAGRRRRVAAIRILVFVNGLVLTAATVCWLATLMVAVSGYSRGAVFTSFLVAAGVGGAMTGSKRFEGYLPPDVEPTKHSLRTPTPLSDRTFFVGGPTFWRRWSWHLVVAAATCALVLVSASHTQLILRTARLGTWSMWLTTVGLALSVILTLLSLQKGRGTSMWRWGGCGTVSALAHILVAGVATALLSAIPDSRRPPLGRGLALLDVWGIAIAAGAAVAIVTAIVVLRRASPYENVALPDAERFIRGTPRAKRAARIAQLPRHLDLTLTALTSTAMVGAIVVVAQRGRVDDWTSLPNWWTRIALVVLAPLAGILIRDVRRNASSLDRRRRIGQVWDVLSFWPRSFHPLAVRPYSERAVPELIEILNNGATVRASKWILTAHSQGAVIAASALVGGAPTPEPQAPPEAPAPTQPCVDLITFGSPLRNLYAKAFPHYVSDDLFEVLQQRLTSRGGTWLNVWRATDPVGREMYASALQPHSDQIDVNHQQPNSVVPTADPTATDLEQDTPLGAVDAHSGYRRTRLLRSEVLDRRATRSRVT